MHTNHNRIKVSDLETDDPDKILVTNSKGELEFIPTKNIKVDSYNALDYDQEGKALDARQGKILKDLVNNKTDKGGFQGTAQDLANSIPDLNSSNLKLGSYPSTRNDGQLSTNKVLSTDTSGNLKLYSLPISITYPAPYLTEIPNNYLPDTTTNIVLEGSFFTPNMTVEITGQIVHSMKFISDNLVHVNVTTGESEGYFDVTLNNGISATFKERILIVLGDVFKPKPEDWIVLNGTPDLTKEGEIHLSTYGVASSARWNRIIDGTKKIGIKFKPSLSPLNSSWSGDYSEQYIELKDNISNDVFRFYTKNEGGYWTCYYFKNDGYITGFPYSSYIKTFEVRITEGKFYFYNGNIVLGTVYNQATSNNMTLSSGIRYYDLVDIKLIEYNS